MADTIKRNRKIFDYLKKEIERLDLSLTIEQVFEKIIFTSLSASDTISVANAGKDESILNNDGVLIETLKLIGLMEAAKDEKELLKLLQKKEKNKGKKPEKTDFDKILGGIMKVPKPKEDK